MIGFSEIALIFIIILIFFGPSKLPEVGKWIGTAVREAKKLSNFSLVDLIERETGESEPSSLPPPGEKPLPSSLTESPDVITPDFTEEAYARQGSLNDIDINGPEKSSSKSEEESETVESPGDKEPVFNRTESPEEEKQELLVRFPGAAIKQGDDSNNRIPESAATSQDDSSDTPLVSFPNSRLGSS